jgi:hypothetical protein
LGKQYRDKRIHGTTRKQVAACFEEERPHLQPLPDKRLDALMVDLSEKLIARTGADRELLPSYLDLTFFGRVLERVGDHGTNIAKDAFWRNQATDIRHTYRPNESPGP